MPANAILNTMMQRLFASMARGASLNCRPHASRSRLDLTLVSRLKDVDGSATLESLLSEKRVAAVTARVPMPAGLKLRFGDERTLAADLDSMVSENLSEASGHEVGVEPNASQPKVDPATQAWLQQRALLTKLRN